MSDTVETDLLVRATTEGFDAQQAALNKLAKAENDLELATKKLDAATKAWSDNTDPGKEDELRTAVLNARVALDGQAQSVQKLATEHENSLAPATEKTTEENKGMIRGFADLKAALDISGMAIEKVGQAYQETVGKAIAWGDTVERVSRATGLGSKEASILAVTLGDFGLSAQTTEQAAKALREQGLTPTIDTLKKLAAQYQSIQDPAARNEWGIKTLGKAYFSLGEILEKTPAQLDAVAKSAETSGKVMDEKAVAATQKMALEMAQLNDAIDALKINIGNGLIPPLLALFDASNKTNRAMADAWGLTKYTAAGMDELSAKVNRTKDDTDHLTTATTASTDAFNANITANDAINNALRDHQNVLDDTTKAQNDKNIADAVATGIAAPIRSAQEQYTSTVQKNGVELGKMRLELEKLQAEQGKQWTTTDKAKYTQNEYALAVQKAADAHKKLTENTDPDKQLALAVAAEHADATISKMGDSLGKTASGSVDNSKQIAELTGKMNELTAQNDAAALALQQATNMMLYQKLSAGENAAVQLELAKSLGIMSEKDYEAAKAALNLKQSFDDGKITLAEFTQGAKDLSSAITGIPNKDITVTINGGKGMPNPAAGEDFGGGTAPTTAGGKPPTTTTSGWGGGAANGGPQAAGGDYMVTQPTWFLAGDAGPERATFTPGGGEPGGLTIGSINVTALPGMDANAVADAVMVRIAAKVRANSAAGVKYLGL